MVSDRGEVKKCLEVSSPLESFTVHHKDNYKFGQEGYNVEKYTGDMI